MREIKFDYVLEVHEQGKTSRKRLSFGYADVFNGTAKHSLDEQNTIGYVVIAKRQYTGLKDRNGVEIYEADIVKILYTDWVSQEDYHTLKVVYEAPSFELMDSGYTLYSMRPGAHGWVEVIGNIYENPELLESK